MEFNEEFFEQWAVLHRRLLGAHIVGRTKTEAYQEDFAKNAENLDAVSNALDHDEWNRRLNEAHQRLKSGQEPLPEPQPIPPEALEEPVPISAPEVDPTEPLISALRKSGSPLGVIWSLVREPGLDWVDNGQNWTKAFLCACLSELVYLRMSRYEVPGRDRYKVIPSSSLRRLLESKLQIDVERLMRGSDVPFVAGETESIVFGTFAFPDFAVIAVRGSMPRLNDWLLNANESRIKTHARRYHAGFYFDIQGALPQIVNTVPQDGRPLYFTGHSMGGAIAGILPQVWAGPQQIMTPYTFASPRFGDAAAAREPVYAYVRAFDPVPHLPPRYSGYRTAGWPPTILPATDRWIPGWKLMWNWRSLIPAHSMEAYRELVGLARGGEHFPSEVYSKALAEALVDPQA